MNLKMVVGVGQGWLCPQRKAVQNSWSTEEGIKLYLECDQNVLLQNMHMVSFELKAIQNQQLQEEISVLPLPAPNQSINIPCEGVLLP